MRGQRMQSVPGHRAAVGRVNGGANAPPFIDLPPQSRRVVVREENTASVAASSLELSFHLNVPFVLCHLNTL